MPPSSSSGWDESGREALEPGVRLDETDPEYGLGLSIAKELSAHYGGSVCLRPDPKSGLVTAIDLPQGMVPPEIPITPY
ncbi:MULTISPECIES: HAMP domain-containing histidine kinase [unclassified Rhizobium]|uniref:HAMP domain-containing histidine kinase n=1 Tax=unclassified Rhizobium TaxID=2613769 RepID=UPI001147327F